MKTEILIESNLFPAHPNEELEINPGRFGKKLGEYIKEELEKNGISVADLYLTDYSYELRIDTCKFKYILTGNMDNEENKFVVSIEPKKKFVRKLFKKIPTEDTVNTVFNLIFFAFQNNEKIKIL